MTEQEMRALLVPHLRPRTRLEAIEKPIVPPLVELAPVTDDPAEPVLIAALDDPDSVAVYADWLEQQGLAARAHWIRIYPDGDFLASTRFGGTPAAPRGEPWPMCTCGDPLRFVGQVSGADTAEPAWYGLFAFYFCWYCYRIDEQDCGGAERAYAGWVVRVYPSTAPGELVRLAPPADARLFHDGFVRAVREQSLPHYLAFVSHVRADEIPALEQVADEIAGTRDGTRNSGLAIGGYPYWFNGPDETPRCGLCREEMELLLQLEPDLALEAGWGDAGSLFLFSCARHRDLFALRTQTM
jgi:uncharacterized protein (TIGR02996 family)